MARLKSYGQKEVLRVSKDKDGIPDLTLREKVTLAFMNNGRVLQKLDVWFKPGPFDDGKERFHSYGWKFKGHFLVEKLDAIQKDLTSRGWQVV